MATPALLCLETRKSRIDQKHYSCAGELVSEFVTHFTRFSVIFPTPVPGKT